jgi:hypothetical protein
MTDVVGWMWEMLGMFEIPHDTCLIGKIQALCLDETPMVKRAAASHLGKYAASIKDKDLLKTEILDMCMSLAKDDQDSVRLLGVENFTQLGPMFTEDESRSVTIPLPILLLLPFPPPLPFLSLSLSPSPSRCSF